MTENLSILILGSTGALGTATAGMCEKRNIPCIPLAHEDFDFTSKEQTEALIQKYHPQAVINCVAIPSINPCEEDPGSAIMLHCNSVLNLAGQCARDDIMLVQPSSHAVFDGMKHEAYLEDDPVKATNVYGATKFLSERIAATYCPKHYIPRFPTLFGPRRNKSMGFVDKVITWIKEGRELRIADDKMDSPTYNMDAADAMISLITGNAPYGIYHIANQGWISYYDFACKIREIMNADNMIHRAKDQDFSSICYKPLRTALLSTKIEPLRDYEAALREYIKDYVA